MSQRALNLQSFSRGELTVHVIPLWPAELQPNRQDTTPLSLEVENAELMKVVSLAKEDV